VGLWPAKFFFEVKACLILAMGRGLLSKGLLSFFRNPAGNGLWPAKFFFLEIRLAMGCDPAR
jgi:hypothetical protein